MATVSGYGDSELPNAARLREITDKARDEKRREKDWGIPEGVRRSIVMRIMRYADIGIHHVLLRLWYSEKTFENTMEWLRDAGCEIARYYEINTTLSDGRIAKRKSRGRGPHVRFSDIKDDIDEMIYDQPLSMSDSTIVSITVFWGPLDLIPEDPTVGGEMFQR